MVDRWQTNRKAQLSKPSNNMFFEIEDNLLNLNWNESNDTLSIY